jgi:hypothetical protein
MKTFNQYVQEHNPLAVKSIVKKLNPLDKQMRKLKQMRKKGITGLAKDALVKSITGKRPKPGATKAVKDELKNEKKARKKDQEKLAKQTKKINDLENQIPGNAGYKGS